MKKVILWLCLMLLPGFLLVFNSASAASKKGKSTVVKYKQYESFDLGNLEIKGDILAPGDLSAHDRQRKVFDRDLYERFQYDKETREDIYNLR